MKHGMGMTGLTMVSILAFGTLRAEAAPRDLQDLKNRWDAIVKTDLAADLMGIDETTVVSGEHTFQRVKTDWMKAGGDEAQVSALSYQELTKGSRDEVMKQLFPSKVNSLAFCKAFPTVTLKDDEEMTEAEKAEALVRQNYKNCKRKVSEMLDGIIHADPYTLLLNVEYKNGSSEVIFYVRSLIESDQYLHYHFQK